MCYVIDKKAKSKDKQFTDFDFNNVADAKKALWHGKEDASFSISCFIKDNHPNDPAYSTDRYEIKEA